MEAETRAQETSDQESFDEDMSENAIEKSKRAKELEMKQQEKDTTNEKILMMTKLQQKVNVQLEAEKQYLKDLEPACVDGDSTYEDRKQARADEIKALKEAQVTLENAMSFVQKSTFRSFLKR